MRIATAQFTCVPADVSANVKQMAALIAEARTQDAELITTYRKQHLFEHEAGCIRSRAARWTV
ncbi:hypothetical protein [Streptomyces sp. NPDC015350]|uniref:hypothetical protein n=1 Tax=Streptomyces sp. NPDC015350 TaxID=3364955 RepID=UPI0036F90EDF